MPILAGLLVQTLVGGFAVSILHGIVKSLIALGVGFVVYQGISALTDSILNQVFANFDTVGATIRGMLGLMNVDKALNVLASAVAVRLTLKGVVNGAVRKFGVKL